MSLSSLALAAPVYRPAPKPLRPNGFVPPLLAAVALHAVLIALLIVAVRPHPLTEPEQAPAFTMVFAPETPPEAPPPTPATESEPAPPVASEPPPAPVPPPVAETPPPEAPPEVTAPSEPPPLSALAEPASLPPPPPTVAQPAPEPPPPPVPVRPPPRPVTPPRRAVVRPRPAPQRPAVQAPPAPPAVPYEPTAPAARPAPAPSAAPAVSAGWRNAVIGWLQEHRKYPEAALNEGAEGHPSIRFTVARDGRVVDVGLAQSSGSRLLDEAAVALVRGAHLPPFPAGMASETVNLTVRLDYSIQ